MKKNNNNDINDKINIYDSSHTILIFDIATEYTGYAIYRADKYSDSGTIHIKGKVAKDRFPGMANAIRELCQTYEPDEIVLESAFMRLNFLAIEYLLKLHGVAEICAVDRNIPIYSVVITAWRGALGFPSNLKKTATSTYKQLSIERACEITGKEITDDNEADAVCIGWAWIHKLREMKKIS